MRNTLILLLVVFPVVIAAGVWLAGRKNKRSRDIAVIAAAFIELCLTILAAVTCFDGEYAADLCGINLRLDGFRCVYTVITAFMWFMTALLSPEYFAHYHNTNRYYLFYFITLGATQGVFLSADLMTTFLFFEVMSLASFPWVAQDETGDALRAANTYLAVAVIGGLVTLMGMFLLNNLTGTLVIDELYDACKAVSNRGTLYAAGACILFGFGAKVARGSVGEPMRPTSPSASARSAGVNTSSGFP